MSTRRRLRLAGPALAACCVASLAGFAPLAALEQWPAFLLAPLDALLAPRLPSVPAPELGAARELARKAWEQWESDVLGAGRVAPGLVPLLAQVTGRRPARHELQLAVPPGSVQTGATVTHRGVLLGFVTGVQAVAAGAASDGARDTATIGLLGRPGGRVCAAEWSASAGGRPVHVLVASGPGAANGRRARRELAVRGSSSTVRPPPGTLVRTRDVSALGDPLVPGLVLGHFEAAASDQPGGALLSASAPRLLPAVDAAAVDLVMCEAMPGQWPAAPAGRARLVGTVRADERLRLSSGTSDGLQRGDAVVQDGVLLGRVVVAGPQASILSTALPAETLLFVSAAGEVVPARSESRTWPAGWEPQRGDLVVWGSPGTGGLVVGAVSAVADGAVVVIRPQPDPAREVHWIRP